MDLSSVVDVQYSGDAATAVAIDASGRVVVGGVTARESDGRNQPFLLRLTSAGAPDTSFSGDGLAFNDRPSRPGSVTDLAVQPDGAIVIGGTAKDLVESTDEAMTGRFLATGAPDTSFGGSGIASYDVGLVSAGAWPSRVTVRSSWPRAGRSRPRRVAHRGGAVRRRRPLHPERDPWLGHAHRDRRP